MARPSAPRAQMEAEADPTGVASLLPPRFWRSFQRNPYPYYRILRRRALWDYSKYGAHLAASYEACQDILRSPSFAMAPLRTWLSLLPLKYDARDVEHVEATMSSMMLFTNGAAHGRLRSGVAGATGALDAAQVRRRVAREADDLLDVWRSRRVVDAVGGYTQALPSRLIAADIGVPPEDRAEFLRLALQATPFLSQGMSPATLRSASSALGQMQQYLARLLAAPDRLPRGSALRALSAQSGPKAALGEGDAVGHCVFIAVAGFLTTANLLGNGLLALLRNPVQQERLRREPSLLPRAVEELGRYDAPVQITGRITTDDVDLHGHRLPKGTRVLLLLGAANRDPRRFQRPDRLDVTREDAGSLLFGAGPHFCLGAPYARLIAEVAFERLLARIVRPKLASRSLQWRPSVTVRGLESLPVAFDRVLPSDAHDEP